MAYFDRGFSGKIRGIDDTAVFAVGFCVVERGVRLIEKIGKFDGRIHSGKPDAQADGAHAHVD